MSIERDLRQLDQQVQHLDGIIEAIKTCKTIVELDGFDEQEIYGTGVPSVGQRFEAHKHTTDGGTYATFEVVSHEWALTDTVPDPDSSSGNRTMFECRIKTRRCVE